MAIHDSFPSDKSLAGGLTAQQLLESSLPGWDWSLFDHQRDFLRLQLHSPTSLLLAGDPGTGKTPAAILSIACTAQALRNAGAWLPCLYVLPANLLPQVEREFHRFAPELRVAALRTGKDQIPVSGSYDVLLVSYTLPVASRRIAEAVAALHDFAFVVFDECHLLRNVAAKRTRFWANLARRARWVLPMSGTPYVNSGEDLYSTLHLLNLLAEPGVGMSGPDGVLRPATFTQFCARFGIYREFTVNGRSFTKAVGTKNADVLNQVLAPRMTRWIAAELLSLPSLIVEQHLLDMTDIRLQMAEHSDTFDQVKIDALLERRRAGEEISDQEIAEAVGDGPNSNALSTYRRLIGTAKAPLVAEWIIDRIAGGGGATLIFGHHRAALEAIKTSLDSAKVSAGLLYGSTSTSQRDQQVQLFQAGALRVLVLQIEVAGLGLNLQAASHVVFAELPWTSSAYQQAIARAHRAGQQQHLLVSIATVPDSLDEIMAGTIARKASEAAAILDNTPEAEAAV
jgi:SWI/SNF-related matrix-associated actin-dependent regulator 1 of chromatin subfamily A